MDTFLKNKPTLLILTILIIVLVGGVVWYLGNKGEGPEVLPPELTLPTQELSPTEAEETLGGQIIGKSQNPLKGEIPETNPFQAETNPLKDVYKNPF